MAKKPAPKTKPRTRNSSNTAPKPPVAKQKLAPASAVKPAVQKSKRNASGKRSPKISIELGEQLKQPSPVGRPQKYTDDMPDRIREYGCEGLTKMQICAQLGITFSTMQNWIKDGLHPDFFEAITDAQWLAQAYWEGLTHQGAKGTRNVSAPILTFAMRARFRESYNVPSRNEMSGPDGKPIEVDKVDYRSKIADRLARLAEPKPKGERPK